MQSRAFLLCAIVLPACGLVSGLDTLHTNDASADATTADASSDASDDAATSDSGADASVVVADGGDSAGVKCGTQTCVSLVCCIALGSSNQYTCQKDGCGGNNTYVLRCDDKSDCQSGTCCFANNTASCGPGIACSSLCNSDNQCATGMKCNPFDAGAGLSLSRCE